jgi:hypothetical protein
MDRIIWVTILWLCWVPLWAEAKSFCINSTQCGNGFCFENACNCFNGFFDTTDVCSISSNIDFRRNINIPLGIYQTAYSLSFTILRGINIFFFFLLLVLTSSGLYFFRVKSLTTNIKLNTGVYSCVSIGFACLGNQKKFYEMKFKFSVTLIDPVVDPYGIGNILPKFTYSLTSFLSIAILYSNYTNIIISWYISSNDYADL